jgi:hypothetical protein
MEHAELKIKIEAAIKKEVKQLQEEVQQRMHSKVQPQLDKHMRDEFRKLHKSCDEVLNKLKNQVEANNDQTPIESIQKLLDQNLDMTHAECEVFRNREILLFHESVQQLINSKFLSCHKNTGDLVSKYFDELNTRVDQILATFAEPNAKSTTPVQQDMKRFNAFILSKLRTSMLVSAHKLQNDLYTFSQWMHSRFGALLKYLRQWICQEVAKLRQSVVPVKIEIKST